MDKNTTYNVKNRSAGIVIYTIPEASIRREFNVGETKKIPYSELEQLSYQVGGREIIAEYLIVEKEVIDELNMHVEPEYNYTEQDIINLIQTGSMDEWLDCLDFAPDGVLDLVKKLSVDLPLSDYNKRQALKEKLGFDVDKAITNLTAEQAENKKESKPVRRTETASGRRTSGINKYKVIKKDE